MRLIIHDLSKEEIQYIISADSQTFFIGEETDIHNCIGCFGCWIKEPGECVIKDSYANTAEKMAQCEEVILITRCCYGGYSPFVKNVMDRSIEYSHPYFQIAHNEMHHKRRYTNEFALRVFFYGEDITPKEKETAIEYVSANGRNLYSIKNEVNFAKNVQEFGGIL